MSDQIPKELSETDQLFEHLLARISVLEAVVLLLWDTHPDKQSIRNATLLAVETMNANDLAKTPTEHALEIRRRAREDALRQVLPESRPDSAHAD